MPTPRKIKPWPVCTIFLLAFAFLWSSQIGAKEPSTDDTQKLNQFNDDLTEMRELLWAAECKEDCAANKAVKDCIDQCVAAKKAAIDSNNTVRSGMVISQSAAQYPVAAGKLNCRVNGDTQFDEYEERPQAVGDNDKINTFSVDLTSGEIAGEITSKGYTVAVKHNGEMASFLATYERMGLYRGKYFLSDVNVLKISTWLEYPDNGIGQSLLKEAKKPLIPPSKKLSFRLLWRNQFLVGTCERK